MSEPFTKKQKLDESPLQRHNVNALKQPQPPLRVGVVTWNVAHFGSDPIDLEAGLKAAESSLKGLEDAWEKFEPLYSSWVEKFQKQLPHIRSRAEEYTLKVQSQKSLDKMTKTNFERSSQAAKGLGEAIKGFRAHWQGAVQGGNAFDGSWHDLLVSQSQLVQAIQRMRTVLRRLSEPLRRHGRLQKFFKNRKSVLSEVDPFLGATVLNKAVTEVGQLERTVHRILVTKHLVLMFENNPWLDAVLLHEVNQGIDLLKKHLEQQGLKCTAGPHLRSGTGSHVQHEYYAMVTRATDVIGIRDSWFLANDGGSAEGLEDKQNVIWSKKEDLYRPVVGYDVAVLRPTPGLVSLGVVHTSPYGKEFYRKKVFAQLEIPLQKLSCSSIPVIVGGDFYLTAEAAVLASTDLPSDQSALVTSLRDTLQKEYEKKLPVYQSNNSNNNADEDEDDTDEEDEEDEDESDEEKGAITNAQSKTPDLMTALNHLRNQLGITFAQRVENAHKVFSETDLSPEPGLKLYQPLTGTNWKTKTVKTWDKAQVADFFVASRAWKRVVVGVLQPSGGILLADQEEFPLNAEYWRDVSDHFPVGGFFSMSMDENDPWITQVLSDLGKLQWEATSPPNNNNNNSNINGAL